MDTFPSIPLSYPFKLISAHKTQISPMQTGKEQRQQRWVFPIRSGKIQSDALEPADIATLRAFHRKMRGSYDTFWFFLPGDANAWTDELVGRGTGSSATYDLPSKNTVQATLKIYVNGVESAATFTSGGGGGGADRITITAALGSTITADFTGILRLKARFSEDSMDDELFVTVLHKYGLGITEVR